MKDKLSLVVVYISILTMSAVTLWHTTHATKETEKKFCDIINTVNTAYQEGPEPTTDLGKKIKIQYAELKDRLDC